MQPVTGPFTTFVSQNSPPTPSGTVAIWYQRQTSSYRQRKPYNLPLDYFMEQWQLSNWSSSDPSIRFAVTATDVNDNGYWGKDLNPASVDSYNRAFAKFLNALKPAQAEMGAVVGERHQSLQMIASRASQLTRFAINLKRFRFGDAAAALGVKPKALRPGLLKRLKSRQTPKAFADAFLEYQFGWAPLVGDVSNAMKTLTGGLPSFRVSGAGTVSRVYNTGNIDRVSWTSGTTIHARVKGFDPNIAFANQLGLVNPAFVAWELAPFSFVLDYFVNVGDWLNGFTDLLGYDLADQTWSWKATMKIEQLRTWSGGYASWTSERTRLQRATGVLSGPSLALRPRWTLSPTRAATSVSLLLQALGHK